MRRLLTGIALAAPVFAVGTGASGIDQGNPAGETSRGEVVIEGCLIPLTANDTWMIEDRSGLTYSLVGIIPKTFHYWQRPARVRAKPELSGPYQILDFSTLPIPSVRLEESFLDFSTWRAHEVRGSGLVYSVPATLGPPVDLPPHTYPNFVTDEGQVTVIELELPGSLFPNSNLSRGIFGIYTNPHIETRQSCQEFGHLVNATPVLHERIAGNDYSTVMEFEGVTGHRNDYYRFHTWSGERCYEVQVLFEAVDPFNADLGCTIPIVKESEERVIVESLVARVHFVGNGRQ